jgi:hypothetical protein
MERLWEASHNRSIAPQTPVYLSADMVCYEVKGVPVDIELFSTKADIENDIDPLITCALKVLKSKNAGV